MRQDIENSILATFLYANDMGDNIEDAYKLDTAIFTSPYRQRIAEKINDVQDGAYGFLSYEIEESTQGTVYEQDFINILAQTPLGIKYSKKYHDKLQSEKRMEVAL